MYKTKGIEPYAKTTDLPDLNAAGERAGWVHGVGVMREEQHEVYLKMGEIRHAYPSSFTTRIQVEIMPPT